MALELAHESKFFRFGLVATMTEFGRSVDELESDLFVCRTRGLWLAGLAKGENTLLGTDSATLDEDEVLLDFTIVWETTQWCDSLFSWIGFCCGIEVGCLALSFLNTTGDAVDLLVHLGTVVVTILTCAGNREEHSGWVPGTNTGDLAKTLVCLSWELLSSPSVGDTFVSVTLGDTGNVDHFRFRKDLLDGNSLFHIVLCECNLISDRSTIKLDFHDVCLLLAEVLELINLGVGDDTNNLAVLCDFVELFFVSLLSWFGGEELVVFVESLLLGTLEVLVEASLGGIRETATKHSVKLAKTTWGLDISNDTNNHHWWSFNDGDGLNNFLLVGLGTDFVGLTNDVSHTGLVSLEGSKVNWVRGIVLWP